MLVLEIKTKIFFTFLKGHQNSGAPTFFWGLFPLLRARLCRQCSDKIRKYGGLKETFRKKEKIKFLMLVLEILTKNGWYS